MAKTQRIREGEEVGERRKIARCFCGEEAQIFWKFVGDDKQYRVACVLPGCWEGPKGMKESRALTAWNNRSNE